MSEKNREKKCTCNFTDETAAEIGHYKGCPKYFTDTRYKKQKLSQDWRERFDEKIQQLIDSGFRLGDGRIELKSFIEKLLQEEREKIEKMLYREKDGLYCTADELGYHDKNCDGACEKTAIIRIISLLTKTN